MDIDPLRDHSTAYSYDREARDFALTFVAEGWLEEHIRVSGND